MNLKLMSAVVLTGFAMFTAMAQLSLPPDQPATTPQPPDKEKVSYALGMRLALQLQHAGASADVDADAIAQGVKDVLAGRPTLIQEADMRPLFAQAQAYDRARTSAKNLAEGAAFLAKNAQAPGIVVLPDGLQYRILKTGTGACPQSNDVVIVKFRDTLLDGTEIDQKDHLRAPVSVGIPGWQEAIQKMTVGSKWQIWVPSALAYGHEGMRDIGPDSTLALDMELISIQPAASLPQAQKGSGHMGHPLTPDFLSAAPAENGQTAQVQISQRTPALIGTPASATP